LSSACVVSFNRCAAASTDASFCIDPLPGLFSCVSSQCSSLTVWTCMMKTRLDWACCYARATLAWPVNVRSWSTTARVLLNYARASIFHIYCSVSFIRCIPCDILCSNAAILCASARFSRGSRVHWRACRCRRQIVKMVQVHRAFRVFWWISGHHPPKPITFSGHHILRSGFLSSRGPCMQGLHKPLCQRGTKSDTSPGIPRRSLSPVLIRPTQA
jgi:hypothetical protein